MIGPHQPYSQLCDAWTKMLTDARRIHKDHTEAILALSVYLSLHSWRKILYGRCCKEIPWTSFKSDDPSGTNNRLYSQLRFTTAKHVEKGATGKWNVSTHWCQLPVPSLPSCTGPTFSKSEFQGHVWVVLCKESESGNLESEAFMGYWSGRHISTLRTGMINESQHPDVHHLACLASPFIAHEQNTINQQHSKSKDWQKPPGGGGLCVNTCCIEGHVTLLSVRMVSLGAIHILQAI